jgi:hypothetical protein
MTYEDWLIIKVVVLAVAAFIYNFWRGITGN